MHNYTNPLMLSTDVEYCHFVKKDMQSGKRLILTPFEKAIYYDINIVYIVAKKNSKRLSKKKAQENVDKEEYSLDKLPNVSEMLTFSN